MGNKSKEKIKVVSLYHTCDACPSQWEGRTSDGKHIYVRYRWGHLTAGVAETSDDAVSQRNFIDITHGDPFDGCMSFETLVELTQDKIDWLPKGEVRSGWPEDSTE